MVLETDSLSSQVLVAGGCEGILTIDEMICFDERTGKKTTTLN
jgi:hypothetical protein